MVITFLIGLKVGGRRWAGGDEGSSQKESYFFKSVKMKRFLLKADIPMQLTHSTDLLVIANEMSN